MSFGDLRSDAGLSKLNAYLATRSYIEGFKPTQIDAQNFASCLAVVDDNKFPHVYRWHKHIGAFTPCQRNSWPGDKKKVDVKADIDIKAPAKAAAKPAAAEPADEEDGNPFADKPDKPERSPFDQDDDDMTAEEKEKERIMAEKAAKLQAERDAKGKKKEPGRSTLILDVKPLGSDTDMKELEATVRKIEMEGLRWAGSELVPIGYGIKKLRIISVIVDDLVSTDVLREKIEAMEELVQSTDIFAFNKV
jgi:elongation factor 1-beta